jgi:WD40 repeat protein
MATCPSCEHKITKADHQAGTCPKCGAQLPALLDTAIPRLDPPVADVQVSPDEPGVPQHAPGDDSRGAAATSPQPETSAPELDDRPTEAPLEGAAAAAHGSGTARPQAPAANDDEFSDKETRVPPPPADDPSFDPHRTVNPRVNADQTLVEMSLDELPEARHTVATFNASITAEMEPLAATQQETGVPESQQKGKKAGVPLEDSLVIQSRGVRRTAGESAERCDYGFSKLIGEGGMGIVYQARQASLDRDVALKMIKPRSLDESARQRYSTADLHRVEQTLQRRDREWFLSEAMVTANLEHPYIVPVYDVIKDSTNALFYAMKWVRGTPWNKVIRQNSEAENLEILMKVADAVAFAHDKGIIHRDLKPENVMVGAHGEVYVMDWGAALVTPDFERSANLSQSSSGFGSPLYAAPELFLGTIDQIGVRSDVYLLGAVLFEIISGNPPHPYPTSRPEVLSILRSNVICPTEYKGELLDIAKRAMATRQADRYANVQEFQLAIREYEQHANSRMLSKRARANLVKAEQTGDYQDYQHAVFAYDEAYALWHGNEEAREGVRQAKLEYATAALKKGAFDLGLEVADDQDPTHGDVIVKLRAAQKDRETQKRRLQTTRRIVAGLAALIVVGLTVATIWINKERAAAVAAEKAAKESEKVAVAAQKEEEKAKVAALAAAKAEKQAKDLAVISEGKAVAAQKEEEKAKDAALAAAKAEKQAKDLAVISEGKAVAARKEEEKAKFAALNAKAAQEYEAYVAEIGLADSKLRAAAFGDVANILTEIRKNESKRQDEAAKRAAEAAPADPNQKDTEAKTAVSFRGWEFDRLNYLAGQARELFAPKPDPASDLRVESLALDRTGQRYVIGRRDGTALVGSTAAKDGPVVVLKHGEPVLAVAFSPDGKLIATAGQPAAEGSVQLWSADGKNVGKRFAGDGMAVFSLQFAERDGQTWLLTAGANKKVQVWQLAAEGQQPKELGAPLFGHSLPVRQAIFSPDASQIVTVGDDSFAVVWDLVKQPGPARFVVTRRPFMLHNSPILAAAYAPDGTKVVTADEDGQMHVWAPQRLAQVAPGASDLKDVVRQWSSDINDYRAGDVDKIKVRAPDRGNAAVLNGALALHDQAVHSVGFSSDGNYVVSSSDDHTVKFQRLRKPGEQNKPEDVATFRGHGGNVRGCALVVNAGGPPHKDADREPVNDWFVVSAGHDAKVMRWNVASYKEEQVFHDPILAGTTGLDRDILSAVFSPDGSTVLTGGRDHHAYQWDVRTGEKKDLNFVPSVRNIEEGHELPIWTAAYAPRGDWFLTAGMDDRSLLWNTETGTQRARLDRTGVPAVVAISPDGEWIATSASSLARDKSDQLSKKVQFWNVKNLKDGAMAIPVDRDDVNRIERQGRLTALAFAPGPGARLYSGFECRNPDSALGGGVVWELKGEPGHWKWVIVGELTSDTNINAAAFRSTRNRLLTAREDGAVWQYDLDQPVARRAVVAELGESRPIRLLALHPDGNSMLTVSQVQRVKNADESAVLHTWNIDAKLPQKSIEIDSNSVFSLSLAEQGDEALVVAAAPKGQQGTVIRKYNLETGASQVFKTSGREDSREFWGAVYAPANVGKPGERHVLALHGSRAELYDSNAKLVTRSNQHGQVRAVGYSSDGKFMLTAGADGTIKLWDARQRNAMCQIVEPHGSAPLHSAVFTPAANSYHLLSAGRDNVVKLWTWDGTAKEPERTHSFPHDDKVQSIAFSSDGARIVCGCEDGSVWVWKTNDDKRPVGKTVNAGAGGHKGAVHGVAFSKDGKWIVTGGEDTKALVWDADKLALQAVLAGHAAAVRSVAFSPDSLRVVTGSADTFAKVWDPRLLTDNQAAAPAAGADLNGRELLTLSRHDRPVTTVAFAPNGSTILTASSDGDAVLWLSNPIQPEK